MQIGCTNAFDLCRRKPKFDIDMMNQQVISAIENIIVKYQNGASISDFPLCYFGTLYLHNKGIDVQQRINDVLMNIYPIKAKKVKEVLQKNKEERHIRGGMATKKKYQELNKK